MQGIVKVIGFSVSSSSSLRVSIRGWWLVSPTLRCCAMVVEKKGVPIDKGYIRKNAWWGRRPETGYEYRQTEEGMRAGTVTTGNMTEEHSDSESHELSTHSYFFSYSPSVRTSHIGRVDRLFAQIHSNYQTVRWIACVRANFVGTRLCSDHFFRLCV